MKLELKHLKHYIDHDIVYSIDGEEGFFKPYYLGMHLKSIERGQNFKLHLHQLSNYADINSDAMNSLNCDISDQIQISEFASKRISLSSVSVGAFEILVSNHVDVFGLIDQGLALPLI